MAKTTKTAAAVKTVAFFKVTEFMKAWGGAQGEGRATAFREDPTEETMQALLDAAEENLKKLIRKAKKSGKPTTSKTATKKSEKVKAPIAKIKKAVKAEKPAAKKTTKKPVLKNAVGKGKNAKLIAALDAKIVRLRDKRDAITDKAKRTKYNSDIRALKAERAELKAA